MKGNMFFSIIKSERSYERFFHSLMAVVGNFVYFLDIRRSKGCGFLIHQINGQMFLIFVVISSIILFFW